MREVQVEAHQIESEMEQRFKGLVARKETLRGMPTSLTGELDASRTNLEQAIDTAPSFTKTRDLVLERLGGPFDYS